MKAPVAEEVRDEYQLAQEELDTAQLLMRQKKFRGVITHAYYAIFHAARAVVWQAGGIPKTHKGVAALFWNCL
jgi:hypothetical protein